MQTTKRVKFLNNFLNLLGANSIKYTKFENDAVYGTLIYDPNNPEEQQDFCWHMTEENVLSDKSIELIQVLKDNNFVSIDKLSVPIEEVFKKSNETDFMKFQTLMNKLLNVEIRMIDDGEETDSYFLHE